VPSRIQFLGMPELPDILAYIRALDSRVAGRRLLHIRIQSPFLLRTVSPQPRDLEGKRVLGLRRIGKRIVFSLEDDLFAVLHLMIAGRLHWKPDPSSRVGGGKNLLAAFEFESGTLTLTEASTKKRAALYLSKGEEALREQDRGGLEVLDTSPEEFRAALVSENHTLKRALTDPRLFSGIGNAYSDEILHRARLSPVRLTQRMTEEEVARLHAAVQATLREWVERLGAEADGAFPEKVTAFRPEMAVHGKYGKPCPDCGSPVQRIAYAENEANYCATCQTGGKLLADRGLSRLLKEDWPRTLAEMEERKRR
jgi:formamidopyrimidine-DNA glycosylase